MLPQWLDPRKLALQGASLSGEVALENLPRVRQLVERLSPVAATLKFVVNDSGVPIVEGVLATEAGLVCQRCLKPMEQALRIAFAVGVVACDADAAELAKRLDPWLVGEEAGDLHALIEEELLLALPMIPFHPPAECSGLDVCGAGEAAQISKPNPFDVLRQLKHD